MANAEELHNSTGAASTGMNTKRVLPDALSCPVVADLAAHRLNQAPRTTWQRR